MNTIELRAGELLPGDYLVTPLREPRRVVSVTVSREGFAPTVKIILADGFRFATNPLQLVDAMRV